MQLLSHHWWYTCKLHRLAPLLMFMPAGPPTADAFVANIRATVSQLYSDGATRAAGKEDKTNAKGWPPGGQHRQRCPDSLCAGPAASKLHNLPGAQVKPGEALGPTDAWISGIGVSVAGGG